MLKVTQLEQQHIFQGASLALALATCLALGLGLSQWANDWQLSHHSKKAQSLPLPSSHHIQISDISQGHLFGQSPSGEVPISNLQFSLSGIVAASKQNTSDAKAYISVSGEASKIYRTGDQLPYGVKIYAIQQNAVILSKDGQLEKLPLPRQTLHFQPAGKKGIS